MSYLKVESVGRNFGDFVALADISFELQRGEIVTLLGPSGCGKTTLLRAIAGLESIDRGSITLNDRMLADGDKGLAIPPERRGIGMVFQSYALWPHMTVGENIALGLKLKKLDKETIKNRIASALEMVGLPGAENRATSSMSGGQQQRVSLARALALEPACILFDEPLSNLDVLLRDRMRFEIRELLKAAGITAIYVTHDQSEAMVISDRVLIMNKGKLLQSGTPTELYMHPRSRFVAEFFGRTNFFAVDHASSRPGLVKTQDGLEFVCHSDLPVSPGALMGFRPEAMELASGSDACNVFSTRADRAVYLGGVTQIEGKVGNIPVTAMLGGLHTMAADAPLSLRVAPENIMILNGEQ